MMFASGSPFALRPLGVAFCATAALMAANPAFAAKDTLTLGMQLEPPVLDPTAGAASAIREVTYLNIYEGLTRIDAKGEVQPLLAKSWTISPDGLTYSFKLAEGVKFHDGAAFDCSVVKFSYERAVAPDSTNAQKGLFEPIARTECPDPMTAVVTLKRPVGNFLFNMGWGDAVMMSPASVANNKTNPVGTGPFKFRNWVKGDRVEIERNDAYWGTKARLASVTFRFMSDPSAAAAALMSGGLDAFPIFAAAELVPQFEADKRFAVVVGTTQGKTIMSMNNERKPFDDVRVRRAMAHAIDRKALVDAVQSGYGALIGSHYTPNDPGYVDLVDTYPYDPNKARQLLAEAGVKPGTTITLTLPPPAYARRGGEIIAAYLQQVGLDVKLVPVEFAQWLDQVFRRSDFEATIISHTETRDLDIYARDKYYMNYKSDRYRAAFKEYSEAMDKDKQMEAVGQLQRILAEDEPAVFMYVLPKIGIWNAKLKGLWENIPIPSNDLTAVYWED